MIVKIENQEITLKVSTEDKENPALKEFKCDKCNYSASTNTVLKRHKTMKHKPDSVPQPIPKTPVNCVGQLDGCSASTSDYFSPESAISPSCNVKLEETLKSASHPPRQCPCCHEPNSGDPFSLRPSCEKEIQTDGMLDSPWGTWYLDRDKNKMICVRLDL